MNETVESGPESELKKLRILTEGTETVTWKFNDLTPLTGKFNLVIFWTLENIEQCTKEVSEAFRNGKLLKASWM